MNLFDSVGMKLERWPVQRHPEPDLGKEAATTHLTKG